MPTYNGLEIPNCIDKHLIISAFQNAIDLYKISDYADLLLTGETFPPITGYPEIITEADVGKTFLNGEDVYQAISEMLCGLLLMGITVY